LYSQTTFDVYSSASNVPAPGPKTPGDSGAVQPTLRSKPGFKALSESRKGAYVGVDMEMALFC